MKIWDILEISAPAHRKEQHNQNKLKEVNRIPWARGAGHKSDDRPLFTMHSDDYRAYTATKVD